MLTALNPRDRNQPFPDVREALEEPNGLLAVGGCLSVRRLQNAYRNGIFPWFGEDEPILWWSPDPRLVLFPERLKISRSLRQRLRRGDFRFSYDRRFDEVVDACAAPREGAKGTWITAEIKRAYREFHRSGFAHSFEAWQDDRLVGGLYGVAMGQVFFGESMFHRVSDASKAAFVFAVSSLQSWGYVMIDCQVHTEHLASLGAESLPRSRFMELLTSHCSNSVSPLAWQGDAL
jgi:leucyl/phenylalanyl-tRNA---protein transferase